MVTINRRKKSFELDSPKGKFEYPFSRLRLKPGRNDPITVAFVDPELANTGFTYRLASGKEDSIVLDQVLEKRLLII